MNAEREFVLRLRALHNLDGACLEPEFDLEMQRSFCRDPVYYTLACSDEERAVIWRELEKRYKRALQWMGEE